MFVKGGNQMICAGKEEKSRILHLLSGAIQAIVSHFNL